MKIRDSGMPDEADWESLFDVPLILSKLSVGRFHDVAELGCGQRPKLEIDFRLAYTAAAKIHAKLGSIPGGDERAVAQSSSIHALRTMYITNFIWAGLYPNTGYTLARHSTMELTMKVYAKLGIDAIAWLRPS